MTARRFGPWPLPGWTSAACVLVILAGLCLAADEQDAGLGVAAMQHADDTASVEVADGVTVLRITSPRGFGRCDVTAGEVGWPERVAVLVAGFRELERFELAVGRLHAAGSRKQSGQFELTVRDPRRDDLPRRPIGTLDVRVEPRGDGMLVTLPPGLCQGDDVLHLEWTDWLRR
jgi:hypothetical protein